MFFYERAKLRGMESIALFTGKRVLLGVSGSIACYKSVDLASKLTQAGAAVDVIMTEAATRFVAPLTFRSVTGRPVYTDMWDLDEHVQHVGLGEAADLFVIAPATAHTLAKLAYGLADNLLTLTALAARCPLLVAPAMDGGMFEHPTTQANIEMLSVRGVSFAGPAEGRMASGLAGRGRMVEPMELFGRVRMILAQGGSLAGRKVVVTAGPTREPLDPVRFISNRSTGKQGIAIAQAALDAGAEVVLIAGPICEPYPIGAQNISVQTTQEMAEATLEAAKDADILYMVAAVADFRPEAVAARKIKKTETEQWGTAVGLERTLDILTAVKEQRDRTGYPHIVLGFAAETHNAFEYGRDKLLRKGLDFIAVNDVLVEGAGFGVDTNQVTLLNPVGIVEEMGLQSKTNVAERIVGHTAIALKSNL